MWPENQTFAVIIPLNILITDKRSLSSMCCALCYNMYINWSCIYPCGFKCLHSPLILQQVFCLWLVHPQQHHRPPIFSLDGILAALFTEICVYLSFWSIFHIFHHIQDKLVYLVSVKCLDNKISIYAYICFKTVCYLFVLHFHGILIILFKLWLLYVLWMDQHGVFHATCYTLHVVLHID